MDLERWLSVACTVVSVAATAAAGGPGAGISSQCNCTEIHRESAIHSTRYSGSFLTGMKMRSHYHIKVTYFKEVSV